MAANKKRTAVFVVLISCFGVSCAGAEGEASKDEVLKLASGRLAASTARLGERIEHCSRQADEHVPVLNPNRLGSVNASRDDLLVALGYLSFRNRFECERESRLAVAYDLGTLAHVKRHYDLDAAELDAVKEGLVYPPVEQLSYAVRYSKLAPATKQYVEEVVGEAPFDLFNALDKNELLKD